MNKSTIHIIIERIANIVTIPKKFLIELLTDVFETTQLLKVLAMTLATKPIIGIHKKFFKNNPPMVPAPKVTISEIVTMSKPFSFGLSSVQYGLFIFRWHTSLILYQ